MLKIFSKCLLFILMFVVLLGCSNAKSEPTTPATVVTFSGYCLGTKEDNNLYRRLIKRFNDEQNEIEIKIIEFNDYSSSAPDVFVENIVSDDVFNQRIANITEFVKDDEDWKKINPVIRESVTFADNVFVIPMNLYFEGYYANYKLINQFLSNEKAEEKFVAGNYDVEEFFEIIKDMYALKTNDSRVGISTTGGMMNWLPAALDETDSLEYFVWNDNAKNLDFKNESAINAFKIIPEIYKYSFENVVTNKSESYFTNDNDEVAFLDGRIGFHQSHSFWNCQDNDKLDVNFVAYPNQKVIANFDCLCISPEANNKAAAYEVAKYLSFGSEGIKTAISIVEANPNSNISLPGLPLIEDSDIYEAWFKHIGVDGVYEVYKEVAKGNIEIIVNETKLILGYSEAYYTKETNISYPEIRDGLKLSVGEYFWFLGNGSIPFENYLNDFDDELMTSINELIKPKYEYLEVLLGN